MNAVRKYIIGILIVQLALSAFATDIDAKEGYQDAKWGYSIEEAQDSGYDLQKMSMENQHSITNSYAEEVDVYYANVSDKYADQVIFQFCNDRLFCVVENIPEEKASDRKILKRYERVTNRGTTDNPIYTDMQVDGKGKTTFCTFYITKKNGMWICTSMDWSLYAIISKKQPGYSGSDIVIACSNIADKLTKNTSQKKSYAIITLSSDDGNQMFETYVTDALTEAMLNTDKVKIVERTNIDKIMSEQRFQSCALINEATAIEIGNLTGASYVCYGTVKDLDTKITITVKVVDVATAELCSMARDTIAKDDYLLKIGSNVVTQTQKNNSVVSSQKKVSDTILWKCQKERNDFKSYTDYGFYVEGPRGSDYFLFVGYRKADDSMNSYVRTGIYWNGAYKGSFELKNEQGLIRNQKLSKNENWVINGKELYFCHHADASVLFDLFSKSKTLNVRCKGVSLRFQTDGLIDMMEQYGVTYDEVYEAIEKESL